MTQDKELIERLRRLGEDGSTGYGMPIANEAADRIEALEAELAEAERKQGFCFACNAELNKAQTAPQPSAEDAKKGTVTLPKLDGHEASPGIFLVGEPTPVEGSDKLRCLANVNGALCVVELRLKYEIDAARGGEK